MNIQLPSGKTITVSAYEYLFILKDDEVDEFFQYCMAENAGTFIENPFSAMEVGKVEFDEIDDIPESDD
jgi:hypothetical protein